ncbi:MAG TPA: hypothetical protein VJT73_12865, partial [Polyangiaceae bacterium]|nr:hypothetical protein [Polyangiaceae bacterium]
VLRERARETRPDVELSLDVRRPTDGGDEWIAQFERRIRDIASRSVAHLKRGDGVTVVTSAGERVRADRSVGADRILRFLALVEAIDPPKDPALEPAPPGNARPSLRPPRTGGDRTPAEPAKAT